ncbi:hypothetical protein [Nocardia sp. NPDC051570]|uniref:hypothetical protein n=1 Tax=Nocardia sp. NPDC051570 TaxID=3364324 RepID=UPI00379B3AE4
MRSGTAMPRSVDNEVKQARRGADPSGERDMSDETNPAPETTPKVDLKAKKATISPPENLDLSNEVPLDGSATIEVKYL